LDDDRLARAHVLAGRYAVRGLRGQGAMTQVLLGEDVRSGEPVVIKVLDAGFSSLPGVAERFAREAEALGRISHPHVVRSLAAGIASDGLPFHVLEHLAGEGLDEWLRREPRPPVALGLRLLVQTASGLEAVHRAGIVHRDVKPANVMVLGDHDAPRVAKVVDLGFARVEGASSLTPPGTALGTLAYMAPEQLVSDAVDARTDVYALAVVAFRMFSGRLPFEGDGLDLMARQLAEPCPSLDSLVPDADPRLVRVLRAALSKNPARRHPTMAALRDDLARCTTPDTRSLLVADSLASGPVDVFVPGPGMPRQAACFLLRRLGRPVPEWGD
ncbi:MAG: serine/threonine protein kinase, partial [Myxococcales bacterium]